MLNVCMCVGERVFPKSYEMYLNSSIGKDIIDFVLSDMKVERGILPGDVF